MPECRRHWLTLGPEHESLWVRPYLDVTGDAWAAMIVGDDVPALGPGELKGMDFFAPTAETAERAAKAYPGCSELGN